MRTAHTSRYCFCWTLRVCHMGAAAVATWQTDTVTILPVCLTTTLVKAIQCVVVLTVEAPLHSFSPDWKYMNLELTLLAAHEPSRNRSGADHALSWWRSTRTETLWLPHHTSTPRGLLAAPLCCCCVGGKSSAVSPAGSGRLL